MMIWENTKLAFKSMLSSIMRTILSLLGIVIGVASVVAILNLGNSAGSSISDTFQSGGLDIVTLSITSSRSSSSTTDESFGETLKLKFDAIKDVSPVNSSSTRIRFQQDIESATIYGVESNFSEIISYEVADGRWFTAEENISKRQVVVLGADVAENLFPDGNAVGQYVSIFRQQSKRYLVIGVMEEKEASLSGSYNSAIFIPYNTYSQRFTRTRGVGSYTIKIKPESDPVDVCDQLEVYMDALVGSGSYSIINAASLQEMASEVTGTLSLFLASIAGISLVVGGIGIMNIMLVTVAERTKEIGTRKALGASPRVIMGQFITEAIVLTLLGGLIGIIFGTAISVVVSNIAGWRLSISIMSYVVSVGFSMFIGVFFGWYPARKAAKMDPIQALNYE